MEETRDETRAYVAIVGGGIAGGAPAVRLSRAGLAVTVLQQSAEFRDRVRGETMFPWGYAELSDERRCFASALGWAFEQRLIPCQPLQGMRGPD